MNYEPWQPNFRRFLKATALALRAHCRLHPATCLLHAAETAIFLITHWLRDQVPNPLYREREKHCKACHLYNPTLETCGTPGTRFRSAVSNHLEPYGCLCHMPTKARLHVNCWLWEKSLGAKGWPEHLNNKPL